MTGIDRETESGVVALARHRQERVFGKYRGIVQEVDTEGRVRALVPAIGPDPLPWAVAASPFAGADHGLVLMPEVDDRVWIEFEGGDLSRPIWSGAAWQQDGLPVSSTAQRALVSPSGLTVMLDDDAGEIALTHPGGAEIKLTNGEITLSIGSAELTLSASGVSINGTALEVR